MPFYHFTPAHTLKPILESGLIRGATPVVIPADGGKTLNLLYGTQWLTTNKSFKQDWCLPALSSLAYDRNAFRLTIEIPNAQRSHLFTWDDFYKLHMEPKGYEKIDGFDDTNFCDPSAWRIFVGIVHPLWIKAFHENREEYRICGSEKITT